MVLRELSIKRAYDSSVDDILNEFYIPVLANSRYYKRLTGFFSSNSFAIALRGISKFISNKGKMRIICGAKLSQSDINAIVKGIKDPQTVIEESSIRNISEITDEFVKDHINALAWMVANNILEIKIALPTNNIESLNDIGIFHQKIGILEDENGDKISFSGSINETAVGWTYNIEEFKVFRSWIEQEEQYFQMDNECFEKYWGGKSNKVQVYDIPTAVKDKLVQIVKDMDVNDILKGLQRWESMRSSKSDKEIIVCTSNKNIKLRDYQVEAIKSWVRHGYKGIIEMATGTGKTYVALGCIKMLKKNVSNLIVVITTPFKHLIDQWEENLREWGYNGISASSEEPSWVKKIANAISDVNNHYKDMLIIITTHDTFSGDKFIRLISEATVPTLLIADEVHGLGSPERRKGLLPCYKYRLGLSATPKRLFDDEGTDVLFDYFEGVIFRFTIRQAIDRGYLIPYYYYPHFVDLTEEEFEEYLEYTRKIAMLSEKIKRAEEKEIQLLQERLDNTRRRRKKIINNASKKLDELFDEILKEIQRSRCSDINRCLIYCSSKKQIKEVQNILNRNGIIQHKFTTEEDNKEREEILQNFKEGTYQALVAIKCLDEGVDIPSAETAIILASSTNSREFIQRRGRILRLYNDKKYAYIHDVVVIPTFTPNTYEDNIFKIERNMVKTELKRVMEFVESSINSKEALNNIQNILAYYGVDMDELRYE